MQTLLDMKEQKSLIRLAKEYAENRGGRGIVFFIGSGLSKSAGLPDWDELRKHLTKEAEKLAAINAISSAQLSPQIEQLKKEKDNWRAFSILKAILGPTSFTNRVSEALSLNSEIQIPKNYEKLCELDVLGIISLNIDELLARALSKSATRPVNTVYGLDINDRLDTLIREKPFIYQPHGHIASQSSWVFTKEDLDKLLSSAIHEEFIKATFMLNTVVFLGISASDVGASKRLLDLRARGIKPGSHYWITSNSHIESRPWAEENGIELVLYPNNLGHNECIGEILDFIRNFRPQEAVERAAVVGGPLPQITILPPSELYKLDDLDQIRLSLDALIKQNLDSAGEIEFSRYREILSTYKRSIHSAYMMPEGDGNERWFGYRVLGPALGGKTISRVFPGADNDGNQVAIKILDQKRYSDELYLSAFRRGIKSLRILAKNNLGGIVHVRDAYEVPPTIIMDFLNCASLKDAIESEAIGVWTALSVMRDACAIVIDAHLLPEIVLHRDIRPTNILLRDFDWETGEYEAVNVIDFDLSWYKGARGDDFMRTDRESLGFQAPEQFESPSAPVRRTTLIDSYGLGSTLYFCLSKRNPPVNASREEHWPRDVKRICDRALRDSPEIASYVARAIMNAMADKSVDRISVSQIRDMISDVLAWRQGGDFGLSPRFCVEMICALSAYSDYRVDDRQTSFSFQGSHGIFVECRYDSIENTAVIDFDYQKPGNVVNARADTTLNRLREQFPEMFGKFTKSRPTFRFGASRQFSARAVIPARLAAEHLREIANLVRSVCRSLEL